MGEMILPKGIVTNTSWIYDEVARYPTVPPDQIQKYWRVYTTTFTRLIDPTANRLENFWWHVWGSDRRNLPGPILARLFEDISKGPTFVKLRSTANRYEGPSQPSSPSAPKVGAREPMTKEASAKSPSPAAGSSSQAGASLKTVSSSQHQPAKPILKKPRGPSSSGPRPVARFVSPAESETEDLASSASTAVNEKPDQAGAAHVKVKPEKKRTAAATPKKKGPKVVASTASRRRPAMPRRPSSQSSAGGSETGYKESASTPSKFSTSTRSIETINESHATEPVDRDPKQEETMSAKAAGKRPATRVVSERLPAPGFHPTQIAPVSTSLTSTSLNSDPPGLMAQVPSVTREISNGRLATSLLVSESNAWDDGGKAVRPGGAAMSRSRSDMGAPRPGIREWNMSRRGLSQGLISASTVTTSNATAQGTIIEFDENIPANEAFQNALNGEDDPMPGLQRTGTGSSTSSRLVPTQPSTTPPVHLGRSKSQLTLLLERQGDDKRSRR